MNIINKLKDNKSTQKEKNNHDGSLLVTQKSF